MSTFLEVQEQLKKAVAKAEIYRHIIEHLEKNFLPVGDLKAKSVLLTEDKVPVSEAFFAEVVTEMHYGLSIVQSERDRILGSVVSPPAAPQGEVKS